VFTNIVYFKTRVCVKGFSSHKSIPLSDRNLKLCTHTNGVDKDGSTWIKCLSLKSPH